MRTLRYLSLLGLFASAGVALAVGLAVSTLPPSGSQTAAVSPSSPPSSATGEHARSEVPIKRLPPVSAPAPAPHPKPKAAEPTVGAQSRHAPAANNLRPTAVASPAVTPSRQSPKPAQHKAETIVSPLLELKLVGEPIKTSQREPAAPEALVALPDPPVAAQIPDKDTQDALQKVYKNLLGPLTGAAPETVPPPPPGAEPSKQKAVPAANQGPTIQIDQKAAEGDDRLRIQFPETDVREVLDSLAEYANLNILTSRSVQGKVSVRMRNVSVGDALDAVVKQAGYVSKREGSFVYVGMPQEIDNMQQTYGQIKTRVYRPNYVSSMELETLIKPMLTDKIGVITKFDAQKTQGGSGGGGSGGGGSGGSGSSELEGGDGYAGGEVVVVRDYEAVLAQIDEIVAEVDVRPMQVAIEAMILSVKLNDSDKLGINFNLLQQKHPELVLNVGQPAAFQGTGALSVAFTDSHLGAFLDALQETNDTNVIATPRLMVINKQRAEIHIGREQGYVATTTQTETATTATMQMLQTGTLLRLRPFLSSDGLIRMDVHPELSSGEVVEKGETLVPDKEITQVTSNIMIRDGCTVVIGGLMREQLSKNQQRIAYLGGLPIVGALFRNTVETNERQEILVLITPHIVYEPEACREGEEGACEFHRRQAVVAEKMCPLGKRSLGRRYLRVAQNAWAAGERDKAMRYIELAVHFDPQNRAAIDLRSDIWQGRPNGKYSLQPPPRDAGANPLDGPEIAGWLLDDLEREPTVQSPPQHPLDPGRPGRHRDIERPGVAQ